VQGRATSARGGVWRWGRRGAGRVHAIALKSLMGDGVRPLTDGERALLGEWLDRIAAEEPGQRR